MNRRPPSGPDPSTSNGRRGDLATFVALITDAGDRLMRAGLADDEARRDAEVLARRVMGWDQAALLLHRHELAPQAFDRAYASLVQRRTEREPIHLILGSREFWGREFTVSRDVLIPRPETELIVQEALTLSESTSTPALVADAGTGSGCIAVTLALELPRARIVATDVSAVALAVARSNAVRHGVSHRITFIRTHFVAGLAPGLRLLVANPPYVSTAGMTTLPPEVRHHEPRLALYGGEDGLDGFRELLPQAESRLVWGGWLIVEIGCGQEAGLRVLAKRMTSLSIERVCRDLQGIPRTVILQKRSA